MYAIGMHTHDTHSAIMFFKDHTRSANCFEISALGQFDILLTSRFDIIYRFIATDKSWLIEQICIVL